MADEIPDEISEILLSLQDNVDEYLETLLVPTLTLYTGERVESDPKPPVNLQLSLGGSYAENPIHGVDECAIFENNLLAGFVDNSSVMKRSYLEQNKMIQRNPEEIILINNVQGNIEGNRRTFKRKIYDVDPEWAVNSASENPALLRALKVIRAEANQLARTKSTGHNLGTTSKNPHAIQGTQGDSITDQSHAIRVAALRPELVLQALQHGNSMDSNDFLTMSPSKYAMNVATGVGAFSGDQPAPVHFPSVTANAEPQPPENQAFPILFPPVNDKGKSVMPVDEPFPVFFPNAKDKGKSIMQVDHQPSQNVTLFAPLTFSGPSPRGNRWGTAGGSSFRNSPYLPPLVIEGEKSAPVSFSNFEAVMPMPNPFPGYMAATSSSSKGKAIADPVHYDPYLQALAAKAYSPSAAALAFSSNPWTTASIPVAVPIQDMKGKSVVNFVPPPPPPPSPAPSPPPRQPRVHPLRRHHEIVRDSQVDLVRNMPTVSTTGGLPDGRTVEGFLYRYNRYEEVVIVCLCHGGFFSPREFVKHAGGGDVENPMRVINIVPPDN